MSASTVPCPDHDPIDIQVVEHGASRLVVHDLQKLDGLIGTQRAAPWQTLQRKWPVDGRIYWLNVGAGGGNRTLTGRKPHGILSSCRIADTPLEMLNDSVFLNFEPFRAVTSDTRITSNTPTQGQFQGQGQAGVEPCPFWTRD